MKFRDKISGMSELKEEKQIVADLYGSNRKNTLQLQTRSNELNRRESEQIALWNANAPIFEEREPQYTTVLRAVRLAKTEFVEILKERVDEMNQVKQAGSKMSNRDLTGMLSHQKNLRAFGELQATELPRLQASLDECEKAVENLEQFVQGLINEFNLDV